jgi:hypothetical protein
MILEVVAVFSLSNWLQSLRSGGHIKRVDKYKIGKVEVAVFSGFKKFLPAEEPTQKKP